MKANMRASLDENQLKERVLEVIEKEINPKLLEHEGWIELEEMKGDRVTVRFRGACNACASIYSTLEAEVKPPLLKAVPQISEVAVAQDVSDELLGYAKSLLSAHRR